MALSAEFEGDELQEAKERFFREAETAGRLTHPNIVTIYDAGEEHDLAYIAMEFLKGKDLVPYTKQPNLLPPGKVLSIVERVADALGYAHTMGVVHRDIKPANIMYEPESDTAKVTDFGIARITDSSKTKTGMVLGTPSYMSPEQLAGKKIDGRSDLFSLGVTLYQMLCGRLPFEGESMTQLMFAIASNPHPPIREYNPTLPPWIDAIIDKALAKDFEPALPDGPGVRRGDPPGAQERRRRGQCRSLSPRRSASPCTAARSRSSATSARTASSTSRGGSSTARTWRSRWAGAGSPPGRRCTTCGCASPWTASCASSTRPPRPTPCPTPGNATASRRTTASSSAFPSGRATFAT